MPVSKFAFVNRQRTIYLKGFFLLIVFSLNTIVSFACSTSELFHNSHHSKNSPAKGHSHQHGGHHNPQHDHGQQGQDHEKDKQNKNDDDCCAASIISLAKIEKSIARSIEVPSPILMPFIKAFISLAPPSAEIGKTIFPDFIRWRPPATIQDLRIVIQSFQI